MTEHDAVTDLQGGVRDELGGSLQGVEAGVNGRGDAVEVVVEDTDADREQQRVDGLLVRAGNGVDDLLGCRRRQVEPGRRVRGGGRRFFCVTIA